MHKIKLLCIPIVLGLLQGCAAVVAGGAASSVMMAQDRRTPGTIVEDKSIQLKCTRAIHDVTEEDPNVHVAAVSYNNRVLLVGQVPTRKMRSDIEDAVKRVAKVKQLHNEIQLNSPTPLLTRSKDSWITTKIKGEMAVTQDFNPTRVKVVTEDGIVYLLGLIKKEEEFVAVDIARHVKGVKKVVKIFEYEKA
ncbi:BON domain-containing protein [Candidatus Berkiella aquae]|uniref:BON domain-containing protein n=1 Tax=Candidatus Berkiella aquae TaxID=295108 RepID=A0A0Q9YS96_9GAMM|nr:BON domain-containing protein [Candidatus Berkiella aquae]MCS5710787.1 BON domain-containing protein [Candidatus Berkiella aquae]